MRNKEQLDLSTENALLLEQHARLYMMLRDKQELLDMAVAFIERQSGGEHVGNMNFERANGTGFWIGLRGRVYERV